jgi:RHS repeat-associated protein
VNNSISYTNPTFSWEYNLTDHLGNVRAVIAPAATAGYSTLLQQTHYYPGGMAMSQISTTAGSTNNYLYNGKELQTSFNLNWYDYGARFYDPALGRWHSVDPLAELNYQISPYAYCLNNPVRSYDPNGMYSLYFNGEEVDGDAKKNLQSRLGLPDDSNLGNSSSQEVETGIPTSLSDLAGMIGNLLGLGLKNEIGSVDFDIKQSKASENREMTLLAIETANGVMSILVPVSSVAELMSKIEKGHGLAALAAVPFVVLDAASAGQGSKVVKVTSSVKMYDNILKLAQETFAGNTKLRNEANSLIHQLRNGNFNPGTGTEHVFGKVFEARSRGGARVYFMNSNEGANIVGYSNKATQPKVINALRKIYE